MNIFDVPRKKEDEKGDEKKGQNEYEEKYDENKEKCPLCPAVCRRGRQAGQFQGERNEEKPNEVEQERGHCFSPVARNHDELWPPLWGDNGDVEKIFLLPLPPLGRFEGQKEIDCLRKLCPLGSNSEQFQQKGLEESFNHHEPENHQEIE